MYLLVPAYPGCPGSKAVKRSLLLLLLYFTTGHFHICVLTKNVAYFPFNFSLSFQRLTVLSFMGIKILLLGFNMQIEEIKLKDYQKRS